MADVKISELPVATSIASPDIAPIVQGGVTKKADVSLFGGSGAAWGNITGTLSDQIDLQSALTAASYWDATYQVTGSDFTTTGTGSLQDITGLSFMASANSLYEIEILLIGHSSDPSGVTISTAFSGIGATGVFQAMGGTGSGTQVDGNLLGVSGNIPYWNFSNTNSTIWIQAGVITGANTGNITSQIRKVSASTATVLIGSVLKVKKLA